MQAIVDHHHHNDNNTKTASKVRFADPSENKENGEEEPDRDEKNEVRQRVGTSAQLVCYGTRLHSMRNSIPPQTESEKDKDTKEATDPADKEADNTEKLANNVAASPAKDKKAGGDTSKGSDDVKSAFKP